MSPARPGRTAGVLLLSLVALAVLISVGRWWLGEPMTFGEASVAIIFTLAVAIATVIIGPVLQHTAVTAATLTQISQSLIYWAVHLELTKSASAARTLASSAIQGEYVIARGDDEMRERYVAELEHAAHALEELILRSTWPYRTWRKPEWEAVRNEVGQVAAVLAPYARDDGALRAVSHRFAHLAGQPAPWMTAPLSAVEGTFRSGYDRHRVTTNLNWDMLHAAGNLRVAIVRGRSAEWLPPASEREIYSVVHTRDTPAGREFCAWNDPGAEPTPFHDFAAHYEAWRDSSKTYMDHLVGHVFGHDEGVDEATHVSTAPGPKYRENEDRLTAEVLTMEISPTRQVVIDGNHRLGAIYRPKDARATWPVPIDVVEYRITGVFDAGDETAMAELMPDLAWHVKNPPASGVADTDS